MIQLIEQMLLKGLSGDHNRQKNKYSRRWTQAHCKRHKREKKSGALWELGRGKVGEVIECIRLAGVRSRVRLGGMGQQVGDGAENREGIIATCPASPQPSFGSVALILAQRLVGPSLRAS